MSVKLYELLSIEGDCAKKSKSAIDECIEIFTGDSEYFTEVKKVADGKIDYYVKMSNIVSDELKTTLDVVETYLDNTIKKEITNAIATADLQIGDKTFLNVPATALLSLENKLKSLKSLFKSIPILPPNKIWKNTDKKGISKNVTLEKNVDENNYIEEFSSAYDKKHKKEIVDRLDLVLDTIKKARQKANDIEIIDLNITKDILKFILNY